jgi:hypothetical protein
MEPWMGGSTITVVANPRKRTVRSPAGSTNLFQGDFFRGLLLVIMIATGQPDEHPWPLSGSPLGTFSQLQMSQETRPAPLDTRLPAPARSIVTCAITALISAVIPRVAGPAVSSISAVTALISAVPRYDGTRRTEHLVRYAGHRPLADRVTPTRASAKCQHRKDCKNYGGFFDHTLILLSTRTILVMNWSPLGFLLISLTNLEVNGCRKAFPIPFTLLAVLGNAPRHSFVGTCRGPFNG